MLPPGEDVTGGATGLPGRVAQMYYTYGLFAASHPKLLSSAVLTVAIICSIPVVNMHLPSNTPQELRTTGPAEEPSQPAPVWFREKPVVYIQQVLVRAAVTPWQSDMILTDAYRAPLSRVFALTESIANFQHGNGSVQDLCFRAEEPVFRSPALLDTHFPRYTCLLLSPAVLWGSDRAAFQQDSNIIETVVKQQKERFYKTTVSNLVFGVPAKETAFTRIYKRQRFLTYAVTVVLRKNDPELLAGLRHRLLELYPLHASENGNLSSEHVHIFYPARTGVYELLPVALIYIILFIYIYFSVRKMESVKSKLAMSVSALVTVFATLMMSSGILIHHGLQQTLNSREVFPYLIVVVGFENVMVITESVSNTARDLNPRIRIAQGLSRQGWNITKNLFLEITILTIGILTFIPLIQEFCMLAVVGMCCDFFLQLGFFAATLSIDTSLQTALEDEEPAGEPSYADLRLRFPIGARGVQIQRSQSHPGTLSEPLGGPASVVKSLYSMDGLLGRLPRRLTLFYLWARSRFFQRLFSVFLVAWMGLLAYNGGLLHQLLAAVAPPPPPADQAAPAPAAAPAAGKLAAALLTAGEPPPPSSAATDDDLTLLRHRDPAVWHRLHDFHWMSLMRVYNVTTRGGYVTVLPPVYVSLAVSPQEALQARHPRDAEVSDRVVDRIALTLGQLEIADIDETGQPSQYPSPSSDYAYVPSSPFEVFLVVLLALPSIAFIIYLLVVLYRCVCSRNYAEWRSSWGADGQGAGDYHQQQVVLEALPLRLSGHSQQVECLQTDGQLLVSCCLAGQVRVWDAVTGDCVRVINRGTATPSPRASREDVHSDYGSGGSPPSRGERHLEQMAKRLSTPQLAQSDHQLTPTVDLTFSSRPAAPPAAADAPYDFSRFLAAREPSEDPGPAPAPRRTHRRVWSAGSAVAGAARDEDRAGAPPERGAIWCMDCSDGLLAVGCSDGSVEVWDAATGALKLVHSEVAVPVTHVRLVSARLVVARFNGTVHILTMQAVQQGVPIDWGYYSCSRPRLPTGGDELRWEAVTQLRWAGLSTARAHQQLITVLECCGGRIVTGSLDHMLRVTRLEDGSPVHTLHGHYGTVTALFVDRCRSEPATAGSGSAEGTLSVWDLTSGLCLYSVPAHDGAVTSLNCNASYILSTGGDERLCVWERFQGHLISKIALSHAYCSQVILLTSNLFVTSRQGSLMVWDLELGEPVRLVRLGDRDSSVFVRQMTPVGDAIVCDYGSELRIVRFPPVSAHQKKEH
ncbi:Sterol regulatory element-binding protein cleavage-activating protein [Amphibalanus amphitrite]|uniref:Sterol regulatory element-binding protein cleavage-activating protein n=1 Tax=Amphibalanus amphitrite TaxID=1232801 RepID=A0A6A4W4X4_AMPAM|nr:Sterol regulatory element-binding protein cleavage-activating protein [Amphibalanus amphitrite]KAF0300973.1 Sterol regulatory element-binding protein cleavage-activating protein [Amphibalanus amphitrite]